MSNFKPTEEQQSVIYHKSGHARVLAVAGSGKTITMVHRIGHLINEREVNPKKIRALMFNRLAKLQFDEKIAALLPLDSQPFVSTFHGFAYQFIEYAKKIGAIPSLYYWVGEEEEQVRRLVHQCIRTLEKDEEIPLESVDVDDALEAIGLWKGALIEPNNAGHVYNDHLPLVYGLFERERRRAQALTFDDFLPVTVRLLEGSETLNKRWCGKYEHLIVDEYQDVNLGQQRLIELLAGDEADVLVVGDDDQTIYEWRGARPSYIIRDFQRTFANKPLTTYQLTRTFRFGPLVAQLAQNAISHNANRVEKDVIAFRHDAATQLYLRQDHSEQSFDVQTDFTNDIQTLLNNGTPANQIWVLGRMFSQLSSLQMACLAKRIPFRILGGRPFFERTEIERLLQYLDVSEALEKPITRSWVRSLAAILNVPSRKIRRKPIEQLANRAANAGISGSEFLGNLSTQNQQLRENELKQLRLLHRVLSSSHAEIRAGKDAGMVLEDLVLQTDFESHFRDYYGDGEASIERIETVRSFIDFAVGLRIQAKDLRAYIDSLDITQGKSDEETITFTTVYRTKGLEFDYVFIPDCVEGFMPCLYASDLPTFDISGQSREPDESLAIESERRLFYVAITRARKAIYIGTSSRPTRGHAQKSQPQLPSRFLEEIMLELTEKMFLPVTTQTPGNTEYRENWVNTVRLNAGHKGISRNLSTYLSLTGANDDAEWVGALAEKADVAKFQYQVAYSSCGKKREKAKPISPDELDGLLELL